MLVQGDAVHCQGEADQVEVLAGVADGVGQSEPEGVVEVAVDRFGVVAAGIQPGKVRISRGDLADVLGAVEAPSFVFGVGVEPDGDGSVAGGVGESVVVVPPVSVVFAGVAVGSDAGQGDEIEVAGVDEAADADLTASRVEVDGAGGAVGVADRFGVDPHTLFVSLLVGVPAWVLGAGFGGGAGSVGSRTIALRVRWLMAACSVSLPNGSAALSLRSLSARFDRVLPPRA